MPCKDLQTKLAVQDPLTEADSRHVETCPECAAFAAFELTLDPQLVHWRASVPPLRRRSAPVRRKGLAYAGIGLAAALSFALLALPTRSTAQTVYRRMLGQMAEVRTVHLVVRWRPGKGNPEDGPLRKTQELWWRPGAWREQWEGSLPTLKREEPAGLTFYRYDRTSHQVQSAIEVASQTDYRSFDLARFAGQFMAPPARFDQPSPTQIVATNAGGWSRMVFTLDPRSGLPTHAEKQFRGGSRWVVSGELEMEFNEPILEEKFLPEDLKVEEKP